MATGPAAYIEPIDPEPEDAAGGLLESVTVITPGDNAEARRWENGFSYRPRGGCGPAQKWAPCSGVARPVDPGIAYVTYSPFVVFSAFECSSRGLDEDERRAVGTDSLDWYQGDQIELELWRGELGIGMYAAEITDGADTPTVNPFLAQASTLTDLTTVGTAETAPLMYALADLQQALRECLGSKRRGVIHCTTKLASLWYHEGGLITDGDTIRDPFGNLVVCGAGYDGSSPVVLDGTGAVTSGGTVAADGRTEWAYATGPVVVRLGPVAVNPDTTGEALDRATNLITFEASRTAAAYYDPCCHLGVNVDLCNKACSAVGS